MITKKDFIAIAKIINSAQGDFNLLVSDLIKYFREINPNFNEVVFIKACKK